MNRVAVVLAAGAGRRFGSDKLSASFRGEPLFAHAVRAARAAPVERVILVAHPALSAGAWPGEPPVEIIRVASAALSDSLKAGVAAAGSADALFVFLGDMPLVPHEVAGQLVERIGPNYAAMPRHGAEAGHPVLLCKRAFDDLAQVTGDAGAGKLLRTRDDVVFVDVTNPLILADVDRPEDLTRMAQGKPRQR